MQAWLDCSCCSTWPNHLDIPIRMGIRLGAMRRKTTLSLEEVLIDKMKMQAIRERRDVSTITEQLYAVYLEKAEKSDKRPREKQKA